MNIVKQFDDPQFFAHIGSLYEGHYSKFSWGKGYWMWGLGDDGEVYCQSPCFGAPIFDPPDDRWHHIKELAYLSSGGGVRYLTLSVMKRLIKEFDKWMVWL